MEFGVKVTSRVCRGHHGEVGIMEFGLYAACRAPEHRRSLMRRRPIDIDVVVIHYYRPPGD